MFCSQFVYCMLRVAGLDYFKKKPEEVKPTDFVELDYMRCLEYHGQIFVKVTGQHHLPKQFYSYTSKAD